MWEKVKFTDVVKDVTGGNKKINQDKYLKIGKYPIIDQGEKFIGGYFDNDLTLRVDKPVIVFGDHSRCIKYVDFDFILGADGVKVLEPFQNLDSKYLFYFLKTIKLPNVGYSRHFKFLKESIIPLPPLPIQEKIAEILDKADELRRKDKDLQSKYDELAQAIFIDMFGDPVKNEKGWEMKRLEEFLSFKTGPFGSILHKEDYIQKGIPVINPTHIVDSKIKPDSDFCITEKKYLELKAYAVKQNDILIGRRGEMGRCGIVEKFMLPMLCGTGCFIISNSEKLIKTIYLHKVMLSASVKDYLEHEAIGVTMKNLNTKILKNIAIGIPPIHLQETFAKKIELINQLKAQTKAEKSEELFQSLLQKAFKGELVS